jgi:glycosyltransferase involved in cell wall biosynthesis
MIRAFSSAVREELAGVQDGLVHAHWWFPAGAAVPRRGRMVVTCHGTDVRILESSRPGRWLGRRVLRRAAVVTTVSRYLAGVIERRTGRSVPDSDIQAMPLADVPRPVSRGGGGIVIIGRLTAQKRVDLALQAIARLRARGWEGPVNIVGDGPERARLKVQLGSLGLGDLAVFAGTVPQTEIPRWLERADLCLITARHEGLGLVAAEALMQGVPTIACTDGGGLLDVVPYEGGGRVVAPDPEAIAAAAQQLLEDPEAPTAAGRLGQLWQERLSPEGVAERCVGWYQRVLDA